MSKNNDKTIEYFRAFVCKKIREGVTQKDMADHLSVSRTTINHLVNGRKKSFRAEWQHKLADFFGIDYEQMIETGRQLCRSTSEQKPNKNKEIHIHIHLSDSKLLQHR